MQFKCSVNNVRCLDWQYINNNTRTPEFVTCNFLF